MRIIAIVLGPTGLEMVNQMLSRLRIKTVQILIRERTQQQFRLIEPTGTRRRIERSDTRMRREVGFGVMINMRGSVVHNQMNTPCFRIPSFHLPYGPEKVFMVIRLQATAPHPTIVNMERHQE